MQPRRGSQSRPSEYVLVQAQGCLGSGRRRQGCPLCGIQYPSAPGTGSAPRTGTTCHRTSEGCGQNLWVAARSHDAEDRRPVGSFLKANTPKREDWTVPTTPPKPKRIYKGTCSIEGCGRVLRARGLCASHYARWQTTGSAEPDVPIGGKRWTQERAEAVALSRGVELTEPFTRVDREIGFRCLTCGHEGITSIHRMRRIEQACWPCSRVKAGRSRRLSPEEIEASFSEAGFDLIGRYRRSSIPVLVRCRKCERESDVKLDNVRTKGSGCSWCQFEDLSERYRLSDDNVSARAELAGIQLLEPFTSTHHSIRVRCLHCDYESTRKLNWIKPSPGCVRCGHRPYEFGAPSVLYLVQHVPLDALKIGVANTRSNRLKDHQTDGWDLLGQIRTIGEIAYGAERLVLGWWRDGLQMPPFLGKQETPHGGWTETISASAIDAPAVLAFMREAVEAVSSAAESTLGGN